MSLFVDFPGKGRATGGVRAHSFLKGEDSLALAWVGRGTFDVSEWDDAFAEASDTDPESAIDDLLDMPLLAAHLEAGLAAFDYSCDGVGQLD